MTGSPNLKVLVEWEDPGGVRVQELHATWCRLEIWVGDECVTLVEEEGTKASRRAIYVPLYPLSEWIAYNWWYLLADHRPGSFPRWRRSYSELVRRHGEGNEWLRRHNLRSAGEGFPWPDLAIIPAGEGARLTWTKGELGRGGIRYLSSGQMLVPSAELRRVLTDIVETTLSRLDEAGLRDTRLHEEWQALQALDAEEVEFCEAVGKVGLDPFDIGPGLASSIVHASGELDEAIFADFLDAVDPSRLGETLAWVVEAARSIDSLASSGLNDLQGLRDSVEGVKVPSAAMDPWRAGLVRARAVREYMGLADLEPVTVEAFVSQGVKATEVRGVDGYGIERSGPKILLSRAATPPNARFASARALYHVLVDPPGTPFLLTRAQTVKQKAERAFAAEFLAPAEGIQDLLRPIGHSYDPEDVQEIADRYGVSTMVIEHQIENNVYLGR